MTLPWNDTPMHECEPGKATGPIVPFYDCRPFDAEDVRRVRCAACGVEWHEHSVKVLAQVYWSAGAYEGKEAASE